MAHVGQEVPLGLVGLLRRLFRQPQLLGPAPLRDVAVDAEDRRVPFIFDGGGIDLQEHPAAVLAKLDGLEIVEDPPLQDFDHVPPPARNVLGDPLQRHADEFLPAEAVDLAGPGIDVEDGLILG